jgi:hypothetical protein
MICVILLDMLSPLTVARFMQVKYQRLLYIHCAHSRKLGIATDSQVVKRIQELANDTRFCRNIFWSCRGTMFYEKTEEITFDFQIVFTFVCSHRNIRLVSALAK